MLSLIVWNVSNFLVHIWILGLESELKIWQKGVKWSCKVQVNVRKQRCLAYWSVVAQILDSWKENIALRVRARVHGHWPWHRVVSNYWLKSDQPVKYAGGLGGRFDDFCQWSAEAWVRRWGVVDWCVGGGVCRTFMCWGTIELIPILT